MVTPIDTTQQRAKHNTSVTLRALLCCVINTTVIDAGDRAERLVAPTLLPGENAYPEQSTTIQWENGQQVTHRQ